MVSPPQQPSTIGPDTPEVTFQEALWVWLRVALLSFGGPTGQIAVMHRILVEERKWISEHRFLHALNFCMLLPGPEAQQLATYIGWLLHRTRGALAAGLLFIAPGFFSIWGLSVVYVTWQHVGIVQGVFFGLKAAVMAVVVEAVVRIGKRALKNEVLCGVAAAAFVAIFLFEVPFPLIIAGAALIGYVGGKLWEHKFYIAKPPATNADDLQSGPIPLADRLAVGPEFQPSLARAVRVAAICLFLWFAPIALCVATLGWENVFVREALFFSKMACVTFGGAYSVLAYVAQEAVETYGWLNPQEMLDGLGMAETTPGPLIMVVEFVGFLGAYRNPGNLSPLVAGSLAAVLTTWVTFVPCFLYILVGAPYIDALRAQKGLSTALSSVTAAVVGVVMNLAVWFAVQTLFRTVYERYYGPVRMLIPEWSTLNPAALAIAIAAFVALVRFHANLIATLLVCMLAGLAWQWLQG